MPPSTHTDEDGNVLAVYDDGDLGVYVHKNGTTDADINSAHANDNTSAGGKKVGESLHSLSFADQSLYNKKGKVKAAEIKIDFGSTELTEKVRGIMDGSPSLFEYANNAVPGVLGI